MSYWRMLVELEEVAAPFEVNVVLGEDAVPGLLEKVRREGKLLCSESNSQLLPSG